MKIYVLRLGHRFARDKRITTHVGLIARALGADGIIISGDRDDKLVKSLEKVVELWGGPFEIQYVEDWYNLLKSFKKDGWELIHLTVYGLPIQNAIDSIRSSDRNKL
ncbi:MAG: tRNA (cytidine(56)-2'-O)-methyltransferase, partial [Candidatus Bathyarchaeia archaeon]